MSMSETLSAQPGNYPIGQRLVCEACRAEIEIINPCTCTPPDQVLQCCGKPMVPSTGNTVNIGVE